MPAQIHSLNETGIKISFDCILFHSGQLSSTLRLTAMLRPAHRTPMQDNETEGNNTVATPVEVMVSMATAMDAWPVPEPPPLLSTPLVTGRQPPIEPQVPKSPLGNKRGRIEHTESVSATDNMTVCCQKHSERRKPSAGQQHKSFRPR